MSNNNHIFNAIAIMPNIILKGIVLTGICICFTLCIIGFLFMLDLVFIEKNLNGIMVKECWHEKLKYLLFIVPAIIFFWLLWL